MFVRISEFMPKIEKKEEFIRTIRNEVLPLLKKQTGFVDLVPLFPEDKADKAVAMSLWTDKRDADRYERDVFHKVQEILKPYLNTPITVRTFTMETTLTEHFGHVAAA